MAYPSTIANLSDPTASDRLNNPSHSGLHQSENTEIEAIQTFIGTTNTSVLGTLLYDIRSPLSDGGGHVQAANRGGTGQTSYTKGDMLVATSASVLTKLVAGLDGQTLLADSSVAAGVKWGAFQTSRVANSGSVVTVFNSASETSVMSVSIPGSTLGTGNAIRAKLFVTNLQGAGTGSLLKIRGSYGASSIVTMNIGSITGATNTVGTIEMNIIANQAVNAQRAFLATDLAVNAFPYTPAASFLGMKQLHTLPLAEDSGATKTLGLTCEWNGVSSTNSIVFSGYTVEKII